MDSPIWFENDTLGVVQCKSQGITGYVTSNQNIFQSLILKMSVILANSKDPDKMPQNVAFYLGLYCLVKYPFTGFGNKGLTLKAPIMTAADGKFCNILTNFREKKRYDNS